MSPFGFRQLIASAALDGLSFSCTALRRLGAGFGEPCTELDDLLELLVESGILQTDDELQYSAGERIIQRMPRQSAIFSRRIDIWDGTWLVVRPDEGKTLPQAVIERMALARFALSSSGAWTRPDNLSVPRKELEAMSRDGWSLETDVVHPHPRAHAAELWDQHAWSSQAESLIQSLDGIMPESGDLSEEAVPYAIVAGTAAFYHLTFDPSLPPALSTITGVSARLYISFRKVHMLVHQAVSDYYGIRFLDENTKST